MDKITKILNNDNKSNMFYYCQAEKKKSTEYTSKK